MKMTGRLLIRILMGILCFTAVHCRHVDFWENSKIAKSFECLPRPRSIRVRELIENQDLPADIAMPSHAILHR